MNKRERELLREILEDSLELQKEGQLTMFGLGQMYLSLILLNGVPNKNTGRNFET